MNKPQIKATVTNNDYLTSLGRPQAGAAPKTVWLVAPPKTGSTWLSKMLIHSFLWPIASLLPRGLARRAQEIIIPPEFGRSSSNILLPHHHTKATEPTLQFIKLYKVTMIVQTRNIFDTAVSLIDHLTQDGVGVPIEYVPMSFRTLPFEQRANIVCNLLIPWYIGFYASWAYAERDHSVQVHYVSYESLLKDTKAELAACLTAAGEMRNINVLNRAIQAGSNTVDTRFNQGVAGRGLTTLPTSCVSTIRGACEAHQDPIIREAIKRIYDFNAPNDSALAASSPVGTQSGANIHTLDATTNSPQRAEGI